MPIITADQTRTRLATPLTSEQLDSKYGLVQGLITTAADEGKYSIIVTLGSDDQTQFTSWIQGYGYRVTASDATGTQIRKIVGDAVNLKISWAKITATVTSTSVRLGNPMYVNIATQGVANSSTVFWTLTGTLSASELLENTLQGTINTSTGSATLTLNVQPGATVGHTAIVRFYWNSDHTDLAATAPTVTFVAV